MNDCALWGIFAVAFEEAIGFKGGPRLLLSNRALPGTQFDAVGVLSWLSRIVDTSDVLDCGYDSVGRLKG